MFPSLSRSREENFSLAAVLPFAFTSDAKQFSMLNKWKVLLSLSLLIPSRPDSDSMTSFVSGVVIVLVRRKAPQWHPHAFRKPTSRLCIVICIRSPTTTNNRGDDWTRAHSFRFYVHMTSQKIDWKFSHENFTAMKVSFGKPAENSWLIHWISLFLVDIWLPLQR